LSDGTTPALRVVVLSSGSGGNVTLVETPNTRLLVDAGLPLRTLDGRLAAVGLPGHASLRVDAIVVTHAHGDHAAYASAYGAALDAPVFMSEATARGIRLRAGVRARVFGATTPFDVGDLEVRPLPVPHDAPQVALVVVGRGGRVALVTDLGEIPDALPAHLAGCGTVLVEANHDAEMLARGPYPTWLRARVSGRLGHLENRQAAALLQALDDRMRHVVLMHLSEKNNTPERAREVAAEALRGRCVTLTIAAQRTPLDVPVGPHARPAPK
jgi:phosphoribosyl 1,2-cyclic phosphodiesterase